jgi:hypothetical protein
MGDTPIMSATDTRQLLSLAYAKNAIAGPAAAGGVGIALMAKQLDQARATLRDGETFSISA